MHLGRTLCASVFASAAHAAWPNGPFVTNGRWITDAGSNVVTYAGVNWPGSADTMMPEGLQYQSIASIVSKIKSLGMNVIRLTYATQMIDDVYDNGGKDIAIQAAFTKALGEQDGAAVYAKVIANNPSFNASTTRLQVFDAVAAECAKQQIYVHLDNHISKAGWCCSPLDGNSWPGDTYFPTSNWLRGLAYMADRGRAWPNLMSMSLRNELRQPITNTTLWANSYNWRDWYDFAKQGAAAISKANPAVLIFLSGLDSDTTLAPVVQGTDLTPGTAKFSRADFGASAANKLVLELHNYLNILGTVPDTCAQLQSQLSDAGFSALQSPAAASFPVVMTEFGFEQNATAWKGLFASCLEQYLPAQRAGWMIWVLAGSYYVRQGNQDVDEKWGLLSHDWSAWRSPDHVNGGLVPMVKDSLSFSSSVAPSSTTGTAAPAATTSRSAGVRLCPLWGCQLQLQPWGM